MSTKVELRYALFQFSLFSDAEQRIITYKLANRINSIGEIVLVSSVERSQWRNKEKVIEKFFSLDEKVLTPQKKRIKTKPTKASKRRRIGAKSYYRRKSRCARDRKLKVDFHFENSPNFIRHNEKMTEMQNPSADGQHDV